MTVAELIEKLKEFPSEMRVFIEAPPLAEEPRLLLDWIVERGGLWYTTDQHDDNIVQALNIG